MEPSHLKQLERLLCELMDAAEIRRFVAGLFGRSINSQLPAAEVSHGFLAHATVTVLERNGHINPELFRELMGERPQRSAEIQAVADEFGFAALPVLVTGALPAVRVRTPDYVVRDTYESLRAQRARLRELTHGEIHLARLVGQAMSQDLALQTLPSRVTAWIDAHRHEITLRELQSPLEGIYAASVMFTVDPQAAALGVIALLFFGGHAAIQAVQQLAAFSTLSDQNLYELALKLVEERR